MTLTIKEWNSTITKVHKIRDIAFYTTDFIFDLQVNTSIGLSSHWEAPLLLIVVMPINHIADLSLGFDLLTAI